MKKLFEDRGDVQEIYHRDAHDGQSHIEVVQDVKPYLDANKREIAETRRGTPFEQTFTKVASIPMVVLEQWTKELGDNPLKKEHKNWFTAKLNSNEFRDLRTRAGNL